MRIGRLLTLIFLSTAFLSAQLFAEVRADPTGLWDTFDRDGVLQSTVSVRIEAGKLYGHILSLHQRSDKNPVCDACEGVWRDQPVIGMEVINGLMLKKDVWQKGTIFDPESGKSYRGSVWLDGGTLFVRGHIGFLYQTRSWQRAPEQGVSEQSARE